MTIGDTLKKIRKEKSMTQVEFAKFLEMSRSFIGDIENNRYTPDPKTIKKLSNKLGVSTYYLTTGKKLSSDLEDTFPFKVDYSKVYNRENLRKLVSNILDSELSHAEEIYLYTVFDYFKLNINNTDNLEDLTKIISVLNGDLYLTGEDEADTNVIKEIEMNRFKNLLNRNSNLKED